ncbi:hypothetical protein D1007_13418 [Hordeum vulgare]|nr:hypothetical protein D1007_13418 [Hordeum vulgare]
MANGSTPEITIAVLPRPRFTASVHFPPSLYVILFTSTQSTSSCNLPLVIIDAMAMPSGGRHIMEQHAQQLSQGDSSDV